MNKLFFLNHLNKIKSRYYILSNQDYEINKIKKKFSFKPVYLIIILILVLGIFGFAFSLNYFYKLHEYYGIALQVIITVFVLLFSIFFYYLQKYDFIKLTDLFEDNTLKIYLTIIFLTVILLSYTLIQPNCDLIYNQSLIALYFLSLVIVFLLPWKLDEFIKNYPSKLSNKLYGFLRKEKTKEGEEVVNQLCDILYSAINKRDVILSKVVIDELYDLLVIYLIIDKDIKYKHYIGVVEQERINNSSNWYSKTILECLKLNYSTIRSENIAALDKVISYRLNNIYILSKEFNDDNVSSEIVEIYKRIFKNSVYLNQDLDFLDTDFLRAVNKTNSNHDLLDLFTEEYLIYLIENKPSILYNQIYNLIFQYRNIESDESPKLENITVIFNIIQNIIEICNKLAKWGYIDNKIIKHQNEKLLEYYKELQILCILIMIYNSLDNNKISNKIKKIKYPDKKIIVKIKSGKICDLIDSESYFRDYNKESTEKRFNKNKFNCTIDTYYKLKKGKL